MLSTSLGGTSLSQFANVDGLSNLAITNRMVLTSKRTSDKKEEEIKNGEDDIEKYDSGETRSLVVDERVIPDSNLPTEYVEGILDIANEGSGLLRPKFAQSDADVYISASQIRRFNLRIGDKIGGQARRPASPCHGIR